MSFFNQQDEDQYDYLRKISDVTANITTLKPYSQIIQKKKKLGVCINDMHITSLAMRSMEEIIKKAQEYIEEQVIWIYYDETEPQNIVQTNPQPVKSQPRIEQFEERRGENHPAEKEIVALEVMTGINSPSSSKQSSSKQLGANFASRDKTGEPDPIAYYISVFIYVLLILLGIGEIIWIVIIRQEIWVGLLMILVICDIILVVLTGVIGLFIIFVLKSKKMIIANVFIGLVMVLSVVFLVFTLIYLSFYGYLSFIVPFHIVLLVVCVIGIVVNMKLQSYYDILSKKENILLEVDV